MNMNPITKAELKPGDILLCKIPVLSFFEYLTSITKVVSHYLSTRKFDLQAATPLIHWLIGYLDGGEHFHASFWDGSMLVESRIKGGLRKNDISTYLEDTVDVYRFKRGSEWLGSPRLPVEPLLQKAQELVDRHWTYGFDNAYLLALLCISRWDRAKWVDCLRDLLVQHSPSPTVAEQVRRLIEELRPKIDSLLEALFTLGLGVIAKYREQQGYACSQTVAVIYNEAADAKHPVGTYALPKPNYARSSLRLLQVSPQTAPKEEQAACERKLRELGANLAKLPERPARLLSSTARGDYVTAMALPIDTFYTPRDLAKSSRTELIGRLDLGLRGALSSRRTAIAGSPAPSRAKAKAPHRRRMGI